MLLKKKVLSFHISVPTQQEHLNKEENCEDNIFLLVVFLKSVILVVYNSYDPCEEGEHNWNYGAKFYSYMQKDVHES